MAALIDQSPELMRAIFAIEFQAAGSTHARGPTSLTGSSACVPTTLAAVLVGQADGSIRPDLAPEPTAHAIVVEGIGSAFLWTVDPTETSAAESPNGGSALRNCSLERTDSRRRERLC
ncbi:MAG: hypothetical protein WAL63_13975 [Solirubrobacteraceae bacterium]